MRYEGHRTKHARRHSHRRPSPPHDRLPGNVQGTTAPMPTETGRSARLMRRGLPKLFRSFRLTATLGLSAQPKPQAGAQAWATRFFRHTREAGPGPFGRRCNSRNGITRAPDDGGFTARSGGFPAPRLVIYLIRPSAHGTVTNSRPGVNRLSYARARAVHARARRGPTPQAARPTLPQMLATDMRMRMRRTCPEPAAAYRHPRGGSIL